MFKQNIKKKNIKSLPNTIVIKKQVQVKCQFYSFENV